MAEVPSTPGVIAVFRRTARLMVKELLAELAAAGYPDMQPAFHPVFECIDKDGTRLTELAARGDMSHQAMSQIVATLEQRGYVERCLDPSDRRARIVRLTPEGQKLRRVGTKKIQNIEQAWQARWREAGLDTNVRAALLSALDSRAHLSA